MSDRLKLGLLPALALWIGLSASAWAAGFTLLRSRVISDLAQVRPLAIDTALQAVIPGILLGAGGGLVLRRFLRRPILWAIAGLLALPLGLTLAFLLQAAFLHWQVHSMGMALTGEGGGASVSTSPAIELVVAGLVLGLVQLSSLAPDLAARPATAALWVVGVAASLGLGWFLSAALAGGAGPASIRQGAMMGVVSGLLIAGLLAAMEKDRRRLTTRCS
jgi:hypothetical protein